MVISVLERRSEIGLRRALGATRGHIRVQFLTEALLLSVIGGVAGVAAGVLATAGYAASRGWDVLVPTVALTSVLPKPARTTNFRTSVALSRGLRVPL